MDYVISVAILCGIYIILCSSLNLIMGYGGMFNMGQGAFYGIGAYVSALISVNLGLPFLTEILIAGAVAALFGLLIGFPSIRLRGDYLTFCTYGFAVVFYTIMNNWTSVTNGPSGISGVTRNPEIFGVSLSTPLSYLILVVIVCALSIFVFWRISNSPYGKSIEAIREDEHAALACGRNVSSIRVTVFCVGAFFSGIAGVLYAHYTGIVDPSAFSTTTSTLLVSMVIIGGLGSIKGAAVGALLITIIPEIMRFVGLSSTYSKQITNIIYSVLLIVIIYKRPKGLLGKLEF